MTAQNFFFYSAGFACILSIVPYSYSFIISILGRIKDNDEPEYNFIPPTPSYFEDLRTQLNEIQQAIVMAEPSKETEQFRMYVISSMASLRNTMDKIIGVDDKLNQLSEREIAFVQDLADNLNRIFTLLDKAINIQNIDTVESNVLFNKVLYILDHITAKQKDQDLREKALAEDQAVKYNAIKGKLDLIIERTNS